MANLTVKVFQDGVCVGSAPLVEHVYNTGSRGYRAPGGARTIINGEQCTLKLDCVVIHSRVQVPAAPEPEPESA